MWEIMTKLYITDLMDIAGNQYHRNKVYCYWL